MQPDTMKNIRFVVLDTGNTTKLGDMQAALVWARNPEEACKKVAGWKTCVIKQNGDVNVPAWYCYSDDNGVQNRQVLDVVGLVETSWTYKQYKRPVEPQQAAA